MSDVIIYDRMQERRGTAANLAAVNEVLRDGEICVETDTTWPNGGGRKFKIGPGAWNSLPYAVPDIAPVGGFDPSASSYLYEDFFRGFTTSTATGTSYVTTGSPVVYLGATGSPSAALGTDSDEDAYITLNTGTSSSGNARLCTTAGNLIKPGGGAITVLQRVQIPTLATAAQNFFVQCGLFSGISGAQDAIRAYCVDGVNGGKWVLGTVVGGVDPTQTVNTTIAPVAGARTSIGFAINATGTSCEVFINGVSAGTLTTLPTAAMAMFTYFIKSAGTTARTCNVGYHYYSKTFTTPR